MISCTEADMNFFCVSGQVTPVESHKGSTHSYNDRLAQDNGMDTNRSKLSERQVTKM